MMTRLSSALASTAVLAVLSSLMEVPAARDKNPVATKPSRDWTLDEALSQLQLNPRDPYLQYVVLQLARRANKLDKVAPEVAQILDSASWQGRWGRRNDVVGFATVFNGISDAHRAYLDAGGLGILVGDSQLPHPGVEAIVESYYRLPVGPWQLTADYQFIVNPAFNRDRGPVSVVSARVRTQF